MEKKLLNKAQLAKKLGLKVAGINGLMARRKIPFLRITGKIVRFDYEKVLAALDRYEVKSAASIGRKKN